MRINCEKVVNSRWNKIVQKYKNISFIQEKGIFTDFFHIINNIFYTLKNNYSSLFIVFFTQFPHRTITNTTIYINKEG